MHCLAVSPHWPLQLMSEARHEILQSKTGADESACTGLQELKKKDDASHCWCQELNHQHWIWNPACEPNSKGLHFPPAFRRCFCFGVWVVIQSKNSNLPDGLRFLQVWWSVCWCEMASVLVWDGDHCVDVGWWSVCWCGMAISVLVWMVISVLVWDNDQCVGVGWYVGVGWWVCWCGMVISVLVWDGNQCVGVGWWVCWCGMWSVCWCGMVISVLVWDGECVGVGWWSVCWCGMVSVLVWDGECVDVGWWWVCWCGMVMFVSTCVCTVFTPPPPPPCIIMTACDVYLD